MTLHVFDGPAPGGNGRGGMRPMGSGATVFFDRSVHYPGFPFGAVVIDGPMGARIMLSPDQAGDLSDAILALDSVPTRPAGGYNRAGDRRYDLWRAWRAVRFYVLSAVAILGWSVCVGVGMRVVAGFSC
jgi:hypothetical protein